MMIRKFTLFFLLTLLNSFVFAQKSNLISGNFSNVDFDTFVSGIEAQTNYTFYYDRSSLDSIRITLEVKNVFLPSLLSKIFEQTNFEFSIDRKNNVFITRTTPIQLNLPEGFFRGQTIVKAQNKNPGTQETEIQAKKIPLTNAIENKLFEIGMPGNVQAGNKVNISGYIRSAENGEELSGVSINVDSSKIQVMTDQFGYYSLFLPAGRHTINFSFMGAFDTRRQVMIYSEGRLNVDMINKVVQLKEVVIEPEKERNIRSTVMGMDKLNIASLKQIPSVMGEIDVLRIIQNLPGVKTVGEASTGLNIRGGATDQNLILFNDLNIYNPTHLFGFFSAINPDVIKDVNLYKSSIPAKYGGRISSVLDIISLDGNDKKLSGSAGIGLLTSQFALNGPLVKEKTTFVLGARSTYSDWLLKLLPNDYKNSSASFYDGTIHISHKINKKNQLYLNGYYSRDQFTLDKYTRYQYQNLNANIKWKHNFSSRFYSVFLAGFDDYSYEMKDSTYPLQAYTLNYRMTQFKTKLDFSFFLSNRHIFSFGASSQLYKINPGRISSWNSSLRLPDTLQQEQALESALYFSDQFNISEKWSLEAGVRLNIYNYLGPKSVFNYAPGATFLTENITGSTNYEKGKVIQSELLPDYRIGIRYMVNPKTSMKASFNTLHQFIHQISNTTTITPTDIWKLSDPYLRPQEGMQASLGIYRNFKKNTIETSVEVYYKWIKNYLDYKSGASLLMNSHLETEVFKTKGKAYGAELLVKKTTGKLNGWVSYTWSGSFLKQDDSLAGESINEGNYYPSKFDQPHSVSVIGNYKFSHRFSVSLNINYSTGRPITLPIGIFDYEGSPRLLYSNRNEYRIPDYFRTDLSMNIEGNHKVNQLTHNHWTLGIYNATARKNAYSVYFLTSDGRVKGYKLSIFGTAIPYLTFNIRF